MSKPQTKKELAEAGRRKLEAFRKQKAGKKQPSASAIPDEPVSRPAELSRPYNATPQSVSQPVSNDRHLAAPGPEPGPDLPHSIPHSQAGGSTALPSSPARVLEPPVSAEQPSKQHDSSFTQPAPQQEATNAVPTESKSPDARPRTARSLFKTGLPAPPPLPLPSTAFRPSWMTPAAGANDDAALQQQSAQPPVVEAVTPFEAADVANSAPTASDAESTAKSRTPSVPAAWEEPHAVSAAPTCQTGRSGVEPSPPIADEHGSEPLEVETAAQDEQKVKVASPVNNSDAALDISSVLQNEQEGAMTSAKGPQAGDDSGDDSWQSLFARLAPPSRPSEQAAPKLEASAGPGLLQVSTQAANGDASAAQTSQPPEASYTAAAGYADLSDSYAASKQIQPDRPDPQSITAATYAYLSDEYLGVSASTIPSGPPPRTGGAGSYLNALSSVTASSNGYAALSDSYLSPSALEPRASGALPVSSNAAMGPPSLSTLDPIEQRQLGALPVSQNIDTGPPPHSGFKNAKEGLADPADTGLASFRSDGPPSYLIDVQHPSAAPAGDSLFNRQAQTPYLSSMGDDSVAKSGQGSPLRPWQQPSGPPSGRQQRSLWMAPDGEGSQRQPWRGARDSSDVSLPGLSNGNSRASELSNGHMPGSKDSAATNGLPPLQPDRSWSRDLSEAKEPAVASPPVSVKGAASEDGFAASEGQMKRFKALQQHIDELTREKYELMRGLAGQRRVQESLEQESERFAGDFNRQAQHAQALQQQLDQLSAEVAAQRLALTAATRERDGARASAIETSERLRRLAAEVVELEEKALKAKSEELKREREAAGEREAARRAQAAAKAALQERETLQSILDTLEEDKRAMHAKLRRATLGEHLREGRGSREAGTQTEASVPEEAGTPPPFRSQLSAQTPRQRAESVLQTQPQEDPSVQLASEAMRAFHAQSAEGAAPAELPEAVLQLLPKTLYTGGLAGRESDVAAEEAAALSNIHALLDSLEAQRQSMQASLDTKEAEASKLAAANRDLLQRLESAQQRLELAVSRSQHAATAHPHIAGPKTAPSGAGRAGARSGAAAQLVVHSAPSTPAQPARQPLRAPKDEAKRSALGWFVDLIVPPSQDFQRIGPLT